MKNLIFISAFLLSNTLFGQTNVYSIIHDYNSVPLYNPDFQLMEKALAHKQHEYNEMVRVVRERKDYLNLQYSNIVKLMSKVKELHNGFTEAQYSYIRWFDTESVKTAKYDLSIYSNFLNISNWLKQCENDIYTWL